MIIVTSLSPNHANSENQHNAVESWQKIAALCYSINTESEIEVLQKEYNYAGIEFIQTNNTVKELLGKPLVTINTFINFARYKEQGLLLVNSDIIIKDLPELKEDGITIFSRYDYIDSLNDSKMFIYGFDAFYIPYKFLNIFPPSVYALGVSWWDLALPYRVILNNIPLYYPKGKFAFHKFHETQYSQREWDYIADYFKWEFKIDRNLNNGNVATYMMQEIKKRLIHE